MSLTYYCPSCWNEAENGQVCPVCGADPGEFAEESYERKLIRALNHREPTVPIRAAAILGDLRSQAAVPALIKVATSSPDPYIQEAVVEALKLIGDPRALPSLRRISLDGALRVRRAAERWIPSLETVLNAKSG